MSDVISPVAHALALASSLYGHWDCEPIGPAFAASKSVHSTESTSELLSHDLFSIVFDSMSIDKSKITVNLNVLGIKYTEVSAAYFSKRQLVFMVPIENISDLRTFMFTVSSEGKGVRVEASYPNLIGVRNFGSAVGPDKFLGDFAIAAAAYQCESKVIK